MYLCIAKGLVTNKGERGGGGLQNERGSYEVLPLRKEGGGRMDSFNHAEGGGAQQVLG